MDETYILDYIKRLLHTTIDIGDHVNKNGEHLQMYVDTISHSFHEEATCDNLEDFMKRIYSRGHYVYDLRCPKSASGNFLLYEEDVKQIGQRITELRKGIEILQRKLNGMEQFLENKI